MAQYDLFLDENDWDIYYWATQDLAPTPRETAEGAGAGLQGATASAQGTNGGDQSGLKLETDERRQGHPRSGEWAQTVGTFKPAYRPVPARWKNSEILAMLRRHVMERSAGGVREEKAGVGGEALGQSVRGTGGGGKFYLFFSLFFLPFFPRSAGLREEARLMSEFQVWRSCRKCAIWILRESIPPSLSLCTIIATGGNIGMDGNDMFAAHRTPNLPN
jgi:hypothetical protein